MSTPSRRSTESPYPLARYQYLVVTDEESTKIINSKCFICTKVFDQCFAEIYKSSERKFICSSRCYRRYVNRSVEASEKDISELIKHAQEANRPRSAPEKKSQIKVITPTSSKEKKDS